MPVPQNSPDLLSLLQSEPSLNRLVNHSSRALRSTDIAQCPQTTVFPEKPGIKRLVDGVANTTEPGTVFASRYFKPSISSSLTKYAPSALALTSLSSEPSR